MDCPRCKLPLSAEKYEGIEVDACGTCYGYWLDTGELEAITTKKGHAWGRSEKQDILHAIAKANAEGKAKADEDAACPKCASTMEKVVFGGKSGITLDRCAAHGVWLDSKEMKLVQVWAEHEAERGGGAKK